MTVGGMGVAANSFFMLVFVIGMLVFRSATPLLITYPVYLVTSLITGGWG